MKIFNRAERYTLFALYGRVGEDIILATADCLKRDIQVFKYIEDNGTSPTIYTPLSGPVAQPSLMVAFIEPGHYCAVQNAENVAKISRLQAKSSFFFQQPFKQSREVLTATNQIKLILFNARSVTNKWKDINNAISMHNAGIIATNETRLNATKDFRVFFIFKLLQNFGLQTTS